MYIGSTYMYSNVHVDIPTVLFCTCSGSCSSEEGCPVLQAVQKPKNLRRRKKHGDDEAPSDWRDGSESSHSQSSEEEKVQLLEKVGEH